MASHIEFQRTWTKVISASVGHILEWYDFGVYGYLAYYISIVVFGSSSITGLLSTFLIFGLGFVFRPLGSWFFAHLGDRIGRKNALLITFWLTGSGTLLTGLVPSYASVGISAGVLLLIFRLIQGFGAGGEWGGVGTYLTELGGANRRAWMASWQQFVIGLALLSGSLTGLVTSTLPHDILLSYGWRLPFIIGGAILIPVAAWLRARLPETEIFKKVKEEKKVLRFPVVRAFTKDLKTTLLVIGISFIWTVSSYIMFTYFPTYIKQTTQLSLTQGYILTLAGLVTLLIFVPIIAYLSDKFKTRKKLALIGAIAYIVLPYPIFWIVHTNTNFLFIISVVAFMDFFQAFFVVNLPWIAESYPTVDRYTGFLPYNLAVAFLGGFAPYIAVDLIKITHNPISPVSYVIFAAIVSTISILLLKDTGKLEKLPEAELEFKNETNKS